ncbi:hypothetical protein [Brevibacterium oceani]|uniref:hypothetical protein n=1 Tax=Brevibacterium oceani TaxID=358099 RepID=UPI0015E649C9|nr:hypothetical protein [Brevibacterium oceani]
MSVAQEIVNIDCVPEKQKDRSAADFPIIRKEGQEAISAGGFDDEVTVGPNPN